MKGVIFDLDGVILDSMPIWDQVGEMYLRKLGIQAEPGLAQIMLCMSMAQGAEFLKQRYHLEMDEGIIIKGINHTIADFYACQVQLKEGVEQFLKGLQQYGIKMVVATSCDRPVFEKALKRLDVMGYFDRIFTCTEIGAGKDKPDIYYAAAEYLGALSREIWVFEDALQAIRTAQRAGFRTVGVYDASSIADMDEIKRVSDIYLSKLDNIHAFLDKVSC